MIQHNARHPKTEQGKDSMLPASALSGNHHPNEDERLSTQLRELDSHSAHDILRTSNINTSCPHRAIGNSMTKSILPQAIGLDEVVDPEAFSHEVIKILTDIPADKEGGN